VAAAHSFVAYQATARYEMGHLLGGSQAAYGAAADGDGRGQFQAEVAGAEGSAE
jgi:hypothetical protein